MESVERVRREHEGTFPKKGNRFIEPEKGKPVFPVAEILEREFLFLLALQEFPVFNRKEQTNAERSLP